MARERFDREELGPIGPDIDIDEEEVYFAGRHPSSGSTRPIHVALA
ncbi:MAG: hypothetical protein ABSB99_03675 [Acidimicrobiales bacterium]|jgi:hypothetical protein